MSDVDQTPDDVLDLDALQPPSTTVKFNGNTIEVKAPSLADILKLSSMGKKMSAADTMTDEEIGNSIAEVTDHIGKIIPELAGQEFNIRQLMGLIDLITKMSVPPDVKELDKRGITPDTDPKAPPA